MKMSIEKAFDLGMKESHRPIDLMSGSRILERDFRYRVDTWFDQVCGKKEKQLEKELGLYSRNELEFMFHGLLLAAMANGWNPHKGMGQDVPDAVKYLEAFGIIMRCRK